MTIDAFVRNVTSSLKRIMEKASATLGILLTVRKSVNSYTSRCHALLIQRPLNLIFFLRHNALSIFSLSTRRVLAVNTKRFFLYTE